LRRGVRDTAFECAHISTPQFLDSRIAPSIKEEMRLKPRELAAD
jgi:hypothetical protein